MAPPSCKPRWIDYCLLKVRLHDNTIISDYLLVMKVMIIPIIRVIIILSIQIGTVNATIAL